MTTTPTGILFRDGDDDARCADPSNAAEFAGRAERLGYDSVWVSEGWGGDAFVQLTAMACATGSVGLGTSVVNTFSRSPAALALAAASLSLASDGRFVLGVGAGHTDGIENLHGLEHRSPVRRTHETVELVKRYLGGGSTPVSYDGEVFRVDGYRPLDEPVSVYNAALGDANRRLTGRLCDGWIPFHVPFPALADAFETVADAARERGRDPADVAVSPWVPVVVDDDPGRARDALRRNVARYVGHHHDDTYKNAVAGTFPAAAADIAERWRRGDEDGAAAAVTDEMVRAIGAAGTPAEVRSRLRELADHPVVDALLLAPPVGADDALMERILVELAPATEG